MKTIPQRTARRRHSALPAYAVCVTLVLLAAALLPNRTMADSTAKADKPSSSATEGRIDAAASKPASAQPAKAPSRPVGVEVAQVGQRLIREEVSAVGTLRAAESVMIRPELAGRIASIHFADGDSVRKGALMFTLDSTIGTAELAQARAELDLARSNVKRTRELASQRFVSDRSRDEAESSMRVMQAKLQLVQARLSKARIKAPFDGVVGLRKVSVGDYVNVGADLVQIEDLSSIQVDLRLPERYLGVVAPGQKILLSLEAYPDRELQARLLAIDAQLDANGRALRVRGQLEPVDLLLRTGMFARARLVTGESPNALVVPEEAIVADADGAYVYRVDGETAHRVRVSTGRRDQGTVEVLTGLNPGDRLVVAGQVKLRGKQVSVRVLSPGGSSASGN